MQQNLAWSSPEHTVRVAGNGNAVIQNCFTWFEEVKAVTMLQQKICDHFLLYLMVLYIVFKSNAYSIIYACAGERDIPCLIHIFCQLGHATLLLSELLRQQNIFVQYVSGISYSLNMTCTSRPILFQEKQFLLHAVIFGVYVKFPRCSCKSTLMFKN